MKKYKETFSGMVMLPLFTMITVVVAVMSDWEKVAGMFFVLLFTCICVVIEMEETHV